MRIPTLNHFRRSMNLNIAGRMQGQRKATRCPRSIHEGLSYLLTEWGKPDPVVYEEIHLILRVTIHVYTIERQAIRWRHGSNFFSGRTSPETKPEIAYSCGKVTMSCYLGMRI